MTIVEAVDAAAEELKMLVKEYGAQQKTGKMPIEVYAGFPPRRKSNVEKNSFIYVIPTSFKDELKDPMGTVELSIGFSLYDEADSGISLFNIMEHVRQGLLKKRTLNNRLRLVFDLTGAIPEDNFETFPIWRGVIYAKYNIAQPVEEIDFDDTEDLYRA